MKEITKKLEQLIQKITNDINNQLIIGISSIVFISTAIIAIIFLTQYRNMTLNKSLEELKNRAYQFNQVGCMVLDSNYQRPRDIYFEVIRDMMGTELWIVDNTGNVVLTTSKISDINALETLNANVIKDTKEKTTYSYSDYFKTKTLTVIVPITENMQVIGMVVMHKDVNSIYASYSLFNYLVFISLLISLVLSVILGIIYSNYFTKPLEKITDIAKEIGNGNFKLQTGIKREDQIGTLASTIDQMAVEIDKNITEIKGLEGRAKELVANVSHEFKTPLTLIRGYTMNLKDKTIKPSAEVYDKIITNTVALEKMVNELLDLNRFQSGQVKLKKEKFSLTILVNDLVGEMRVIAKTKNINISVNSAEEVILNADYGKIRQLVTIFLDNAIKYSPNNKDINIEISKNELVITDHGIGMAKNELENIFNRYYKINEEEKGYGLGLCIAKYIADAHHYQILIDSKVGSGTTVKIAFTLNK